MKREEAKRRAELYSALAKGKSVQVQGIDGSWVDVDIDKLNYFIETPIFRIKPEPKYRPFKTQEECWNEMLKHQPFGWVIDKYNNFAHIDFVYSCNPDNGYGVRLSKNISIDFEHLFRDFKFADGEPFGIKE